MEAESYGNLVATLVSSVATSATDAKPVMKMVPVQFDKDPSGALEAPVTEFAFFTAKDAEKDLSKKEIVVDGLKYLVGDQSQGNVPKTWGQVLEDPNTFVVVVGWESVEVSDGSDLYNRCILVSQI